MPVSVADRGANKPEIIEHAAQVLMRSKHRTAVFRAVYTGKKAAKGVTELMRATGLPRNRVLDAGKQLVSNDLIEQENGDNEIAYRKIPFFQHHREQVLRYANNPKALRKLPTKRRPEGTGSHSSKVRLRFDLRLPKPQLKARRVTIDDIESFGRVRKVSDSGFTKLPEATFKRGIAAIVGTSGEFKDWGGEQRDFTTSRLKIGGKRKQAAFAFKGPGMTGRLTPAKMGKNGDQIQRLMRCTAEVFIVQYWRDIADEVLEQLEKFAQLKSYLEARQICYGIIDGDDSTRLITAYPWAFARRKGRA